MANKMTHIYVLYHIDFTLVECSMNMWNSETLLEQFILKGGQTEKD